MTLLAAALLLACTQAKDSAGAIDSADTDTQTDADTDTQTNTDTAHESVDSGGCVSSPVADAGPDQTVPVGVLVQLEGAGLSGCGSYQFEWTFSAVPSDATTTYALQGANTAEPMFTAHDTGRYVLSLSVYDGTRWSATDVVTVTATD